ncbi:MAG TPA: XdhC family protein, partial [Polyangia bacterium]|nr:XdhC family protein [Polyangia bacterium]
MIELQQIVRAYQAARASGRPFVLATVVQTRGSSYRRAGARMLMADGAQLAGAISGGCLEGDLLRKAWWRTADGPTIVRYDSSVDEADEIAWGLGCNGVIDVLLERVTPGAPADPLAFLQRCATARQAGVLATVIAAEDASGAQVGQRLLLDERGVVACSLADDLLAAEVARDAAVARRDGRSQHRAYRDGAVTLFLEVVLPPLPLVIFGGGYDVVPLVEQAKAVGWHVTVVEQQARPSTRARFAAADRVLVGDATTLALTPSTAVVVMTHHFERDRSLLRTLLKSPVGYLGVLGARERSRRLLAELAASGCVPTARELARLHAPVGLDVGAEGADEIALAIVAEVQSLLARRATRPRRDEPVPTPAARSAFDLAVA